MQQSINPIKLYIKFSVKFNVKLFVKFYDLAIRCPKKNTENIINSKANLCKLDFKIP